MSDAAIPDMALRGLKAVLGPARRRLLGAVARAEKDYATHIPVLLGLARVMRVESVLELGCGHYSTLTFLNRVGFPSLVALKSLETDQVWLEKISATVSNDPRVRTELVHGAMRSIIEEIDLEDYDLIFVDDSTSGDERAATIRSLAARKPKRAVVAIHDFEIQAYRDAVSPFQHQLTFKAFNPQTGIVWNEEKDLSKGLRRASAVFKRYAKTLEPDDVSGWSRVLTV